MKKAWVIPAVVCLALLLAWPFRWDRGPIQNNTVRHLHDRWTGDDWVYKYSSYGVDVKPSWSSNTNFTIPSPSAIAKYKLWESKLAEAGACLDTIKSSSEFKAYNDTMHMLMNSYREQTSPRKIKAGSDFESDMALLTAWATTPARGEVFSYAWNNLPEDLRAVGASALEAENRVNEAEQMLMQIKQDNNLVVLDPYARRNFATVVWVVLVVVSGVWAWKRYCTCKT